MLGSNIASGVTTPRLALIFLPIGVFTWQFLEYFFHRYVFHWQGIGPISRRMHDIVHGYHHKYPDDDHRLVFPIGASIPTFALIWLILWAIFPMSIACPTGPAFSPGTSGTTSPTGPRTSASRGNAYEKKLWAHHLAHHFADVDTNYGIDNMWMDRVIGTLRKSPTSDAKQE